MKENIAAGIKGWKSVNNGACDCVFRRAAAAACERKKYPLGSWRNSCRRLFSRLCERGVYFVLMPWGIVKLVSDRRKLFCFVIPDSHKDSSAATYSCEILLMKNFSLWFSFCRSSFFVLCFRKRIKLSEQKWISQIRDLFKLLKNYFSNNMVFTL